MRITTRYVTLPDREKHRRNVRILDARMFVSQAVQVVVVVVVIANVTEDTTNGVQEKYFVPTIQVHV